MSIVDKQKLMFANMMLGGGLPLVAMLVKESPRFKQLKQLRIDALAKRAEMKAKID